MMLSTVVEGVTEDLERTAALGSEPVQQAAGLLAGALANSVRVRFVEALEQAASELTDQMPGASVEVRMQGGEPVLALSVAEAFELPTSTQPAAGEEGWGGPADEGDTARITLRLPERLKAQVEEAAQREGLSVNTWLVEAAVQVLRGLSAGPGGAFPGAAGFAASAMGLGRRGPKRVTGFVRG